MASIPQRLFEGLPFATDPPRCVCFFLGVLFFLGAVLDSLDEFVTEFPLFYSEINNLGGCNLINHSSFRAHVLP